MPKNKNAKRKHSDGKDRYLTQSLLDFLLKKKTNEFAIGDWFSELNEDFFCRLSQYVSDYEKTGAATDDFTFVVVRSHQEETQGVCEDLDKHFLRILMHRAAHSITLEYLRREGVLNPKSPIRLWPRFGERGDFKESAVTKRVAEHEDSFH